MCTLEYLLNPGDSLQSSSFTMWEPGMKLRPWGVTANTFTFWVIPLCLILFIYLFIWLTLATFITRQPLCSCAPSTPHALSHLTSRLPGEDFLLHTRPETFVFVCLLPSGTGLSLHIGKGRGTSKLMPLRQHPEVDSSSNSLVLWMGEASSHAPYNSPVVLSSSRPWLWCIWWHSPHLLLLFLLSLYLQLKLLRTGSTSQEAQTGAICWIFFPPL